MRPWNRLSDKRPASTLDVRSISSEKALEISVAENISARSACVETVLELLDLPLSSLNRAPSSDDARSFFFFLGAVVVEVEAALAHKVITQVTHHKLLVVLE